MLNKLKGEKDMSEKEKRIKPSEMREFWIGIILLAVGLFMLSMKVSVHTGWGGFYIGFFPVTSGTIVIPLLVAVVWYCIKPKSIMPKIIALIGTLIIVAAIIMSVRISFAPTSLFEYVLILAFAAAGLGLILKTVFTDKKEKSE